MKEPTQEQWLVPAADPADQLPDENIIPILSFFMFTYEVTSDSCFEKTGKKCCPTLVRLD